MTDTKKKSLKRQKKAHKKAWTKNQSLNIRRLALANNCIKFSTFKNIIFNLMIGNKAFNTAFNKFLIKLSSKNTIPLDP